jgi:2-polyprenyl-3-methyl-5-hydroxy-6-metoxy-1,4-benzoquinol methylase
MDKFLPFDDDLGRLIDSAATDLYDRLIKVNAEKLGMPEHCLAYFSSSHTKRLFFSTETSAHILYRSIRLAGKSSSDVVLMDYGAGVGTLFLLAKMIGCNKVVYSDHLEDWRLSAELIANAIGVKIDHYIVGDIDECLMQLEQLNIQCDIITSRNVVEHIYKLNKFYALLYEKQPHAIIFSSTTANKKNPGATIKHILWHKKWEKIFRGKRLVAIERQSPGMAPFRRQKLAKATRGLAVDDLKDAIENFRKTGKLPDPSVFGSNTCDPSNGVWAENLLSLRTYRNLIDERKYAVSFAPGFWDTHYKINYVNSAARMLNRIISKGGSLAMMLAPFIYVIARPKKAHE